MEGLLITFSSRLEEQPNSSRSNTMEALLSTISRRAGEYSNRSRGSFGSRCIVKANHFFVELPDKDLHQYDIEAKYGVFGLGNRQYEHFNKVRWRICLLIFYQFPWNCAFTHLLTGTLLNSILIFFSLHTHIAKVVDDGLADQGMYLPSCTSHLCECILYNLYICVVCDCILYICVIPT